MPSNRVCKNVNTRCCVSLVSRSSFLKPCTPNGPQLSQHFYFFRKENWIVRVLSLCAWLPSDVTSVTSGGARDGVEEEEEEGGGGRSIQMEEEGALGGVSGQQEAPLSKGIVAVDDGEDLITVPSVVLLSTHGWRRRGASKASITTPASSTTTGSVVVSGGSEIPRRAPDIVAFALDFHELERQGNAEEAAAVAAAAAAAAASSEAAAMAEADAKWQQREWQKALMWQDFVHQNLEALK